MPANGCPRNYPFDVGTTTGKIGGRKGRAAMNLTDPIFTDETKAREHFEAIRWPDGPYCPHCGETEKVYRLQGKSHRPGLFYCNSCNGSFTVTTGSVMESSHVPLNKWALAF